MTASTKRRAARVRDGRAAPSARKPPLALLDTNVLLDALQGRAPWAYDAAELLSMIERGELRGAVTVHSLATFDYVARKQLGAGGARRAIADLLRFIDVAALGADDVRYAIALALNDFEDALQIAGARLVKASFIVSRDASGFRKSPIQALSPNAALALVHGTR